MKSVIITALLFISCTSQPVSKWPSKHITYSIEAIHLKGVDVIKANEVIHRAFKAWEAAGVKFRHVMHGQIKVSVKALEGAQAGYGYFPPPRGNGVLQLYYKVVNDKLSYWDKQRIKELYLTIQEK